MAIQTSRSPASHPFLNVFVAKLASGVFFLTRHEFASIDKNGTQQKSVNICTKNFSYVFLARVHIWLFFSLVWIFAFKDKMEIYSHFSPVLKRLCCKTCIWLHFSPDMGFASSDKNGTQPTKIYE